jgi:hypothetical protein
MKKQLFNELLEASAKLARFIAARWTHLAGLSSNPRTSVRFAKSLSIKRSWHKVNGAASA